MNTGKIMSAAALALAAAAIPFEAHAGTATASGAAALSISTQCSVAGANMDLGTYRTNQTWGDVGGDLGMIVDFAFVPGAKGQSYLNYGSVTCTAGVPYSLTLKGNNYSNGGATPWDAVRLIVNGRKAILLPAIKQLDGVVQVDNSWAGMGALVDTSAPLTGVGTGSAQQMLGHMALYTGIDFSPLPGDVLGEVGVFSDTLTYTLNF